MANRSREEIDKELMAAYTREYELRIGTPEYKAIRQRIGELRDELLATMPLTPAAFTAADYNEWQDSWEQGAINRKRREAAGKQLSLNFNAVEEPAHCYCETRLRMCERCYARLAAAIPEAA